jgi:predicted DCC family thiol-disulfide oxidoreductase YuxK
MHRPNTQKIIIVYDRECIMCTHFAKFLELRKKVDIVWYDMNSTPDMVKYYQDKWYDIQKGMIIDINNVIYHGPMALTILHSLIQSDQRWQKTLLSLITHKRIAYTIYPIMLLIRKIIR